MTHVTYTSHPLVTIEHRPGGPVIVHDRRGPEEEVWRGRMAAAVIGFGGVAVLGFMLASIWQSGGLNGTHIRNGVLVAAVLLVGVGYWIVVGRGREEITVAGDQLLIRPKPLGLYGGRSISRDEIAYLQVEEDTHGGRNGYRVQIVDRDGYAVLPSFHALSDIHTQEEATSLASTIAQQFNLRFTTGLRPVARHWMSHFEAVMGPLAAGEEPDPSWPIQTPFDGTIRVRKSGDKTIIAFRRSLPAIRVDFTNENGKLTWRYLPVRRSQFQTVKHVPLSNLRNVETQTYVIEYADDSVGRTLLKLVARVIQGGDITLIDKISEADGHALCQALHKHLDVPILTS